MFIRSVYRQRIRRVCIDTGDSVADPQVDRLYAEKHHLVIALPSWDCNDMFILQIIVNASLRKGNQHILPFFGLVVQCLQQSSDDSVEVKSLCDI